MVRTVRVWIRTHPFAKRSKRVCLIVTWRPLGQNPSHENSALLVCHLALQKCRIGPMARNTLSCSGAVWTPLLGFFGRSLYLGAFHALSMIFYYLLSRLFRLFKNNYLDDKYPKINLEKVQIIQNFIFIQSSLLFSCMHPYFKH